MRLTLLAVIFLLLLTLANAYLYRKGTDNANAHAMAPAQATQSSPQHLEWDAFVWREIGAIVITVLVFSGIHIFSGSSTQERK